MPGNDENRKYHLAFTGRLCRRDGCPALREELSRCYLNSPNKSIGQYPRVLSPFLYSTFQSLPRHSTM